MKKGVKLTNAEYDKLIIGSSLTRIGNYVNTNHAIEHKCRLCTDTFSIIPKSVINGAKCKCQYKKVYKSRLSNDEYINKILYTKYQSLEIYKGANIEILHICKNCGTTKSMKPSNALTDIGCTECKRLKYKDEYLEILSKTSIELIDEYISSKTKVKHNCTTCNNNWYIRPNDISFGVGCSFCNISKGENEIRKYLDTHGIEYIREKVFKDLPRLRFDFYLPTYNMCIEFDGVQHFKPIDYFGGEIYHEYIKRNDIIKNIYCANNTINMIRISYIDIGNIDMILSAVTNI